MTVFYEAWDKRQDKACLGPAIAALITRGKAMGYDSVGGVAVRLDEYAASEQDRSDLIRWLNNLIELVLRPDFRLPEPWRRLLAGEVAGTPPVTITRDHFLGIAYVYQTIVDLIEDRIEEGLVLRTRRPDNWAPGQTG